MGGEREEEDAEESSGLCDLHSSAAHAIQMSDLVSSGHSAFRIVGQWSGGGGGCSSSSSSSSSSSKQQPPQAIKQLQNVQAGRSLVGVGKIQSNYTQSYLLLYGLVW